MKNKDIVKDFENLGRDPNPDINRLYNPDSNAFTNALIDHIEQQQLLINKNTNVMNNENFQYLSDNIKYMALVKTSKMN